MQPIDKDRLKQLDEIGANVSQSARNIIEHNTVNPVSDVFAKPAEDCEERTPYVIVVFGVILTLMLVVALTVWYLY